MAPYTPLVSLALFYSIIVALGAQPASQFSSVSLKRISIRNRGSQKVGSASITNILEGYIATTTVGTQSFELFVDTGSSNTWVGAGIKYIPGHTAHNTGRNVTVRYGSGNFTGFEYTDNVSVGDVTVRQQSIGDATSSFGFDGFDGILGVGPADLTNNTVAGLGIFPTYMGNLQSQGVITRNLLGIFFQPATGNETEVANGLLTFGGVDTTKCPGPITYTPRSRVSPYSKFWGVDIESTSYGSTLLSSGSSAIVDTGTTLMYIADKAFQKFLSLTGGTFNSDLGVPSFEKKPTKVFSLKINGVEFPLTPEQYLIPDAQVVPLGLPPGIWSWISTLGPSPDEGLAAILGFAFLESYCSIFDADNNLVGFTKRA